MSTTAVKTLSPTFKNLCNGGMVVSEIQEVQSVQRKQNVFSLTLNGMEKIMSIDQQKTCPEISQFQTEKDI